MRTQWLEISRWVGGPFLLGILLKFRFWRFLISLKCVSVFFGLFFFFFLGPYPWHMEVPRLGAVASGLHHSHSNIRSKLHLQYTPQPTAMPDP